jgi:hypothetical protein
LRDLPGASRQLPDREGDNIEAVSWDLDEAEARDLVEEYLAHIPAPRDNAWVIHRVEELDWGWIIYWVTRTYHQGGRTSADLVAGNGPFMVDRATGRVARAGTAHDVGHYVELWRSGQWPDQPRPV